MSLISISNLTVRFGKKLILDNVHLTVNRNEIVTIIGPNGAGKSTLIRALLGFIPKIEGSIQISPGITIGYMPQKLHIEPYLPLSVQGFLDLAGKKRVSQEWEKKLITMLAVTPLLKNPIQTVSGGELQRILLTRALLRKPDLLVLDEPAQGIDVLGQEDLYQLIREIRDLTQCGILMVSHDLHLVMAGTDFVVCLNKHVCCSGHPEKVTRDPEFLNLFGLNEVSAIAIYTHKHNHRHDMGDDVCN